MAFAFQRPTFRSLSSLGRWEIAQLRPRHLRQTQACSELDAAEALAGAYLFAYWRSVRASTPDERGRPLLSKEHQFLEAITSLVEQESIQRSSHAFARAAQEVAKAFAALEVLNAEIARYAGRLARVVMNLLERDTDPFLFGQLGEPHHIA